MKAKIHPRYYQVEVRCACGNTFKTGSTRKEIVAAVCSKCHPFYTKSEKLLDSAGRVERFQKRFAWTGDKVQTEANKPKTKAAKGLKPLAPVESRARGNKSKSSAAAPAAPTAAAKKPAEGAEKPVKLEAKPEVKPEVKLEVKPEAETKSDK